MVNRVDGEKISAEIGNTKNNMKEVNEEMGLVNPYP